ncbi:MAG: hypothetical protein WCQ50_18295, partial [Spirochaetota bacterium]
MDFLVKLLRPLDEMPKLFSILVKEDIDGDVDVNVGMGMELPDVSVIGVFGQDMQLQTSCIQRNSVYRSDAER